jgi:hypothetical protein
MWEENCISIQSSDFNLGFKAALQFILFDLNRVMLAVSVIQILGEKLNRDLFWKIENNILKIKTYLKKFLDVDNTLVYQLQNLKSNTLYSEIHKKNIIWHI